MQYSFRYTLLFAAAICAVCSVLVSTAAISLKSRQDDNRLLDQRKKVLAVAGLLEAGERVSRDEVNKRFEENLVPRVVELETGAYVDNVDPTTFDQRRASKNPQTSRVAKPNRAKVSRVPNLALVYQLQRGDEVDSIILPIEGKGLWSTLYGYLALADDARTIRGITFYQHGETPGLGGEVDNARWKALWPGRLAFGDDGKPRIKVIKGRAGPPDEDPYEVDGLSGATITSNGVTHLVQFWLGDEGFGPYLDVYRKSRKES